MAKKTSALTKAERTTHNRTADVICVCVIALCIFLILSIYTDSAGKLGGWIRSFLFGMFGVPAYVLAFIVIVAALHGMILHGESYKYWCTGLCVVVSCVLFTIGTDITEEFWLWGTAGRGGGVVGGFIALPFVALLGRVGSILIFGAGLLIMLIVIFEIPFLRIILWCGRGVKNTVLSAYQGVNDAIEQRPPRARTSKADMERTRRQIGEALDVPTQPLPPDAATQPSSDGTESEAPKSRRKKSEPIDTAAMMEAVQPDVQATQLPDEDAIGKAIEVATEVSLLPKKKRLQQTEEVEIDIVNERLDYRFPQLSILKEAAAPPVDDDMQLEATAKKLIDTLKSFGVEAKIVDYSRGPTITRYELVPNAGVKISKITSLSDDIALNLAATGIRIEPIPGKAAIGVEVPNATQSTVFMREVIGTQEFMSFDSRLAFGLGKDIAGKPIITDIARMPHLLIAGSTGSGKSVCINTLITSILYKASPNEVKLVMIDPKVVELGMYNGIPHLLIPVVTDPRKAAGALQWAVNEMTNRYKLFAEHSARDLANYNSNIANNPEKETLPQIVIIIDELADLMMVAPGDVEESIARLAQMARAAGMYLVIATQRPSVDVITGVIKANIPSRIAFAVSSFVDSKTILDMGGAEKLIGRGDMLFNPIGANKPQRIQGAFISPQEVESIVQIVKAQAETSYDENVLYEIEHSQISDRDNADDRDDTVDALLPQAVELALEAGQASVAMYQRKLKIGYQRAARIIDQMEQRGIVGPFDGTRPREILISRTQWNEMQYRKDS